MPKLFPARDLIGPFVRYTLVGVVCAGVDFAVYAGLTLIAGEHPLIANLVSRGLGGTVSFLLNKRWTFKNRGRESGVVQFGRFWVVFGVSFALSEVVIGLFFEGLRFGPVASKLLAEGILVVFNFLSLRFWAFR